MTNYRRREGALMGAALALFLVAVVALLADHVALFAVLLVASIVASQGAEHAYRCDRRTRTAWPSSTGNDRGRRHPRDTDTT